VERSRSVDGDIQEVRYLVL